MSLNNVKWELRYTCTRLGGITPQEDSTHHSQSHEKCTSHRVNECVIYDLQFSVQDEIYWCRQKTGCDHVICTVLGWLATPGCYVTTIKVTVLVGRAQLR